MTPFIKNFSLFLTAFIASVVLLSPQTRTHLSTLTHEDSRAVLATLHVAYDQVDFNIVKVKHGSSILIEIYKLNQTNNANNLYSRFELPNSKDIYYDTKKSMTNLFSANIDEDTRQEILVPVLDQNLDSHLSVIKYESTSKSFSIF